MTLWLWPNLVPRACDPRERTRGSGIIRFREESDWPLKWMRSSILARIIGFRRRIIPEPRVPSRRSQAQGTRLTMTQSQQTQSTVASWPRCPTLYKLCWATEVEYGSSRWYSNAIPPSKFREQAFVGRDVTSWKIRLGRLMLTLKLTSKILYLSLIWGGK
jgi:hypothetical protein